VNLIAIFDYSADIRKIIYTSDTNKYLNSVVRKLVRTRKVFLTDNATLKVIYLVTEAAFKKWTMLIRFWKLALKRFMIECGE
jgi:putative transposase